MMRSVEETPVSKVYLNFLVSHIYQSFPKPCQDIKNKLIVLSLTVQSSPTAYGGNVDTASGAVDPSAPSCNKTL